MHFFMAIRWSLQTLRFPPPLKILFMRFATRETACLCVRISSNSTEAAFLLFIALCKLRFPLDVSLPHYFTLSA
jgi:hypothetical protein